jgi:preprotein translocase subunit SecD
MHYFSRWKAVATLLAALIVCLVAVTISFPSQTLRVLPAWAQRHAVLALAPQSGSHILLEIDANFVRREKTEQLRDEVRHALREARIGYTGLAARDLTVEVRIREGSDFSTALAKLRELSQPLGGSSSTPGQRTVDINDAGGGLVQLTITQPAMAERLRQAVEQSIRVIERRLSDLGTATPVIQRQGADRILVHVPGLSDPARAVALLSRTAKLTFRLVDASISPEQALQGRVPPDAEILYGSQRESRQPYVIEKRVVLSGEYLTDAQPGFDQRTNEPIVSFRFNANGARHFAQVTQENVGRPFAIVLDSEVIAAPVIREPILGGSGQISGGFTVQSANDLAIMLRAGALPAPLTVIEQRVVSASLDRNSILHGARVADVVAIDR